MATRGKKRSKPRGKKKVSGQGIGAVTASRRDGFVVGIGASAGGLEAITRLLRDLPTKTGMAFVFVQHLDPTHDSLLGELLSKATDMEVIQVSDGMPVRPNRVHVIPPNVDMTISSRTLHLTPRTKVRGQHMPVDVFLRSLAEDQQSRAIGVILSGTASDGASGMKAIKADGGITFAQNEESAAYGGMAQSAVAAGAVDFILPPDRIAHELAAIARRPMARLEEHLTEREGLVARLFSILRAASGVDFSHYKQSTIKRRINRRMVVHKLDRVEDYLTYLQATPSEVQALYEDLLINVTSFFRDARAFQALKKTVFPAIVKQLGPGRTVRVWVPGCSTGEEAYSIAICLMEYLGDNAPDISVQIFATDVSESAIEIARAGIYRETIAPDVSPERLRRFFAKHDRGYQVSKSIRDLCIFARQNLTRDPPFSRLDLISCRNVLIYLGSPLQRQAMAIFHYALNPTGYLWLGNSETIGSFADLFTLVDRKEKIYMKKPGAGRVHLNFIARDHPSEAFGREKELITEASTADVQREADRVMLNRFAPASVLINEEMDILHFRGRTGRYLEPSPGQASLNLFRMAHEGLALDVRSTVQKAKKRGVPCRKEEIVFETNGERRSVNIEVIPIKVHGPGQAHYLVTFEETPSPVEERDRKAARGPKAKGVRNTEIQRLKRELASTREQLQAIIEEQEATNEELKSANEEILSSNEELQRTNEELETSKEELQSANEELTTVNEELQNRNAELGLTNADLTNVLSGVNLPIVILDEDLRIRRFTPMAASALNLIPGDHGRRITDIKPNIETPDLERLIREVVDSGSPRDLSVQDRSGRWFSMRIRPYQMENRIDGAVLVFVDVDDLRRSEQQHKEAEKFSDAIIETIHEGLLILDGRLRVQRANRNFYQMFRLSPAQTENRLVHELGGGQWKVPRLLELLHDVCDRKTRFENFELSVDFVGIGKKKLILSGDCIEREGDLPVMLLMAIEDVTLRAQAENAVRDLSGRLLRMRDEEQRRIARELHDSTAQTLTALSMNLALVGRSDSALSDKAKHALAESRTLAEQCSRELHDLASLLHPPLLDEVGLDSSVEWFIESFSRRTGIQVKLEMPPAPNRLAAEVETTLFRIVQECLTNVHRHSGSPTASIRITRGPRKVEVQVKDGGRGLPEPAESVDAPLRGVGIVGMRERVRTLGGKFEIDSDGEGTTVRASIPLPPRSS